MARKTYDPACYDLARHFLQDSPEKDTPDNRHELATAIQQTVEDVIAFQLKPTDGKCDCGFSSDVCKTNPCMRKKMATSGLNPGAKYPYCGAPQSSALDVKPLSTTTRFDEVSCEQSANCGWPECDCRRKANVHSSEAIAYAFNKARELLAASGFEETAAILQECKPRPGPALSRPLLGTAEKSSGD